MSARAIVFETVQCGKEATAGTQVPATKRLLAYTVDADPIIPTQDVEAQGFKAAVDMVVEKEHTKLGVKGMFCFNHILYLLSTGLCKPVITTPSGATNTRRWTYLNNITGPDEFDVLSIEGGSSVGAHSCPFAFTPDIAMDFGMKGASVTATMIARTLNDLAVMTPDPTDVPIHTVAPRTLDVHVGDSIASLTHVERCFKAQWGMANRFSPMFEFNPDEPSFREPVESKMGLKAQIVLAQQGIANDFMEDLRTAATRFMRIIMTGSQIEPGFNRRAQITFPFQFKDSKRGEVDKVYGGTYDVTPKYDATFGGATEIVVDCDLTDL